MASTAPHDGLLHAVSLIEEVLRFADRHDLDLAAAHLEQALAVIRQHVERR